MRHVMNRGFIRLVIFISFVTAFVGCALTGCGSTPPATPTEQPLPTTAPQMSVDKVTSDPVAVPPNSAGHATASCGGHTKLAGGGYNVQLDSTTSQDGVPPTDSVPLNGFAWTVNVTAHAIGLHVTAFAVCLDPDFPVVIETVKASSSGPDASVSCPTDSILTGGGFTSGEGTNVASQPDGNGWKVSTAIPSGGSSSSTAFALCATKGLKAGSVQSQTKTVAKGAVATSSVGCPPTQYPVGGGYNGYSPTGDTFWHVFLNGPDTGQGFVSSGWMAEVHSGLPADSAFTVYSICAAL